MKGKNLRSTRKVQEEKTSSIKNHVLMIACLLGIDEKVCD